MKIVTNGDVLAEGLTETEAAELLCEIANGGEDGLEPELYVVSLTMSDGVVFSIETEGGDEA